MAELEATASILTLELIFLCIRSSKLSPKIEGQEQEFPSYVTGPKATEKHTALFVF